MTDSSLKRLIMINYVASMLFLGAVAFSNITMQVSSYITNIYLASGLMTGISAIISTQIYIIGGEEA